MESTSIIKKAVIVEDEMLIAQMYESDLKKDNIDSVIENDPNKVMDVVDAEKPDVVIMDINLIPGDIQDRSGITLGQKLEKLGYLVIYITAFVSSQLGGLDLKYLIHKPYVDELITTIRRLTLCLV